VFSIIISEKGGAERRETFDQAEVTVGRVQGNDLMLPKGNVSKRHCKLEHSAGRFVVTDQNSTNGTYVNRRRISQATAVREGDRIYVGDFVLRLEAAVGEVPAVPDLPEPAVATGPNTAEPEGLAPALDSEPRAFAPEIPRVATELAAAEPAVRQHFSGATTSEDGSEQTISAVRFVVERVTGKLEPRALDRDLVEDIQRRVDRLLDETYAALRAEAPTAQINELVVKTAARTELLELGPLGALLDDPSVSEVTVAGAGFMVVQRGADISRAELPFCAARSVERALFRLCRQEGSPVLEGERIVRRELPSAGFALEALPAISSPAGAVIRLRRRDPVVSSLDDLVHAGTLSRTMATFLSHCVAARANILVVGPRASGGGEVLAALASAAEPDRVFAIQDEEEFANAAGVVMTLSGEDDAQLNGLLTSLPRFPSHRLLVDGFRGDRAVATLNAICDGGEGVIACLRARSLEKGLAQICSQIGLSGIGHDRPMAEALLACFDVAVEVARLRDGRSRVLRISELVATETGIIGEDVFDFVVERTANGGFLEGTFRVTGRTPHIASEIKAKGGRIDLGMFTRPSGG
jgi:pilus assembly protein CpaF